MMGPIYLPTFIHSIPSIIANSSPPPLGDPPYSYVIFAPLLFVTSSYPNNAPLICAPSFSLINTLILCTSSSSKFVALRNNQGVGTLSPRPLLLPPLLMILLVSPLDTLSSMSYLFACLSSSVILYGKAYPYALPPSVVYFLFILGPTLCCVPLANSFPPIFFSFLLITTLIAYPSTLFLLYSSGSIPFLTSSQ
jgi:hypothetical protein